MIIIGVGANLNHPEYGSPRRTCGAALDHLNNYTRIRIATRSRWYQSAPVLSAHGARGDQPWYVNGVIEIITEIPPQDLLAILMELEASHGRIRSIANSPRTLDLDILAYDDRLIMTESLIVPHPRLGERAFVVLPIFDLNPDWKHPETGVSITDLRQNLPPGQAIGHMLDADGAFGTEWQPAHRNKT